MLATLIRKEFLVNVLSLRFAMSFMLLVLLVSTSMYLMGSNYRTQASAQAEAESANRQAIEQMQSSFEFYAMGITESAKVSPLSVLALGLSPDMSRSVNYSVFKDTTVGGTRYSNPIFILFNAPDLTYVVNVVMSLLAILFTFDAVSGEKEQQTLKLMLSNSVPRDLLLIGKWVGGYVSLLLPFIVAFLVGMLLVSMVSGIVFSRAEWIRIGVYLLVTFLYISVFFTMGLLISTSTQKSNTSLMMGLLVWVVIVLGIPNIAPIISKNIRTVRSAGEMATERRQIYAEEREAYRAERKRLGSNVDREQIGELRAAMHERIRERYEKRKEVFENQLRGQALLAMGMSRLSPSACYVYSASSLMGTGVKDYFRIRDYETVEYPDQFRKARHLIEEDMRAKGSQDPFSREATSEPLFDLDLLPPFEPHDTPLKQSIRDSILDLALMGVYNALFFMIAYVKFLRYDVR